MIHFEVSKKEEINRLGLKYEPDITHCREHMFNDFRVRMDRGNIFDFPENIEKNLEDVFLQLIVGQLKDDPEIERVHKIEWTRIFFFPYMLTTRYFEAAHWLRLYTVDRTTGDSHVQRC